MKYIISKYYAYFIYALILAIIFFVISKKLIMKVWDPITERRIQSLHPLIRDKVREFIYKAEKEGMALRITSGFRTFQQQQAIYNQGRTTPGKVITNARPGYSYHNYGLAIDVVPMENGQPVWNSTHWNRIGRLGKSLGFEWGGDFTSLVDKPHFQITFGKSASQLLAMHNNNQYTDGYLNLAA